MENASVERRDQTKEVSREEEEEEEETTTGAPAGERWERTLLPIMHLCPECSRLLTSFLLVSLRSEQRTNGGREEVAEWRPRRRR